MLFAACFLVPRAARAQYVSGCPESICVASQTSLVYNPQTQAMDAFTSATTDYVTETWYSLCVSLAVMEIAGPSPANWPILLPSSTPPSCADNVTELDQSGSVAATPGRQYFAQGVAQLSIYYSYSDMAADCGDYCTGYWYDAEGYSLLATDESSGGANTPSIYYSYPYDDESEPYYTQLIGMNGSGATAWAPPLIGSVAPNQWLAGATTSFTINGQGFGYSPTFTITGPGVTSYTNACAPPASYSSCNTQIVATVTIDPSTPDQSVETITLTANGYNASGFAQVPTGQTGQATATATTTQFAPPTPQIWIYGTTGTNLANNGPPSCPGSPACVVVGQQIALTAVVPNLPAGVTIQSQSWSQPKGVVIANYVASTSSGRVVQFPVQQTGACQTLTEMCLMYYWVDQGSPRQVTFTYTLANGLGAGSATATFNVGGPTNVGIAVVPTPLNPAAIQIGQGSVLGQNGLVMYFGSNVIGGQSGITLNASAAMPGGNQGQYSWIQLLTADNNHFINAQGRWVCPLDQSPELDGTYNPASYTGPTFSDTPWTPLPFESADTEGEVQRSFKATAYLMWTPNAAPGCTGAACTILVPLATLNWSWAGDAINTLTNQPNNGSTWMLTGCQGCSNGPVQPTSSHPQWQASTHDGCQPVPMH
jgi:hypothetical protein